MSWLFDLWVRFWTWIGSTIEAVWDWAGLWVKYFADLALYYPRIAFQEITEGLAPVIVGLMPDIGGTTLAAAMSGLSDGFLYLAQAFAFGTGALIISGAYLARFLLRRIPFIG